MKHIILLLLIASVFLVPGMKTVAQVAINNDGSEPDESAMLDVKSTDKGILIPRIAKVNRPATPATGLLIYQTDDNPGFYYYDGSIWIMIGPLVQSDWDETQDGSAAYIQNKPVNVSEFINDAGYLTVEIDGDVTNELQTITRNGVIVTLSDGGGTYNDSIVDDDANPSNELQAINRSGLQVTLSQGGGTYNDSIVDDDANPSNELQSINRSGLLVTLSQGGGTYNDSIVDDDANPSNELQTINRSGLIVTLSNGGGTFNDSIADDDANPSNELNTSLQLIDNILKITDAGGTIETSLGSLVDDSAWTVSGNNMYSNVSGRIGIGISNPDTSAKLHVNSTTGGFLIPRMNQAMRDAIINPATGLMIFDTANYVYSFYNGTNWVPVGWEALAINNLTDGKTFGTNLFLGDSAGEACSSIDDYNTATGYMALKNSTGYNSTAFGAYALSNSTTSYNTAFGAEALRNTTTGMDNIAVGDAALYFNTTGTGNTAIGSCVSFCNTTGSYNVSVGGYANLLNKTGDDNTAIGYEALKINTTGHGNVALGYQAGYNETVSNRLYIENTSSTTPLVYGEFDNDLLRINGTLHIGTAYQLPTIDGNAGQVLKTNGSGMLSWSLDTIGATSINTLTDGKAFGTNLFLGDSAGKACSSIDDYNTATGYMALKNSTGYNSTAFGAYALSNATTSYNTAFGAEALRNTTTGMDNIAVGDAALYYNTTGTGNTAIGSYVSFYNTTGSYNVSVGGYANLFNETGDNNTALGYEALLLNTAGHGNVALGHKAGHAETGSNKLYIDNSETGNPLIYGEFDTDLLKINGTLHIGSAYQFPTVDGTAGYVLKTNGSGLLSWSLDTTGPTNINGLADGKSVGMSVYLGTEAGNADAGTVNKYNIGLGYYVLHENTTGDRNTAVGHNSMYWNNGVYNCAFGFYSMVENRTGNNNTAMGYEALKLNQAGHGNVAIGFQAGYNETLSNRLYIENSPSTTPLIYGEFDTDLLRINGTLHIGTAYQFPTVDGTNGQVLKTNGSGVLSWADESIPPGVDAGSGSGLTELVKAVQEQQEMIDELKAQNEALWEQNRMIVERLEKANGE